MQGLGTHVRVRGAIGRIAVVAVIAVSATLLPRLTALAAPRLTITESTTGLVATGAGFAKRTRGTLTAAGVVLTRFRTNGRGRFSAPFVDLSRAAGAKTFTAKAGRSKATTTYSPDGTVTPPPPTTSTGDAYTRRVRAELKVFTDWLSTNGVKGYMGEIGWPNSSATDQPKYNALAEMYLADMKAAGVKGAVWATGEWWGSSYALSPYVRGTGSSSINEPKAQAASLEKYTDTAGIHVNGGEFGSVYGTAATSAFSNVNRGTYNTNWHYDSQATFNYLASRGIREVVIPFRWERIQPTIGGPLDTAELGRLKDAIARAGAAGLQAVPMVANYAAYWLHDPATNKGVRVPIGSAQLPVTQYVDLWTKLSTALKNNAAISAYGLMREPAGLDGSTVRAQAIVWEQASQAAVTAIRANGDGEHLLVSGYRFSNTHTWPTQHPTKWITDTSNNHSYEAHHYWASTYDATYKSYADEVAYSASKGY